MLYKETDVIVQYMELCVCVSFNKAEYSNISELYEILEAWKFTYFHCGVQIFLLHLLVFSCTCQFIKEGMRYVYGLICILKGISHCHSLNP